MEKIKLGEKVRCKITGYTGIAVVRSEFLNGCVQYTVAGKWSGKGSPMENEMSIDQQSLEVVKIKKKRIKKENTGGPNRLGFKYRGF